MPNYLTTQIPGVVNTSNFYRRLPAPTGVASWLSKSISQPYFTPYDVNSYVWPKYYPNLQTRPLPPTGVASWLSKSISQPYFTPYDENWVNWPSNPSLYFNTVPKIFTTQSTISQPVGSYPTMISGVFNPLRSLATVVLPTGAASWLSSTIAIPYILIFDINLLKWESKFNSYKAIANGYGLSFNGVDDFISLGTMGNFGQNMGNGFYCKFQIVTNQQTKAYNGFTGGTGGQSVYFGINSNGAGTIKLNIEDASGNILAGEVEGNTGIANGNLHTVIMTANFSTNTITITLDGVPQTINYLTQNTLTNFINFGYAFCIGERNDSGTGQFMFPGIIDNLQIGTSSANLYGSYRGINQSGTGKTWVDDSGQLNNGTFSNSYPVWVAGLNDTPNGIASWINKLISQPYIIQSNNNNVVFNLSFLQSLSKKSIKYIYRYLPMRRSKLGRLN